MAAGGVIRIDAGNVQGEAEEGRPAEFVRITVADTGHGMPPEVQARVFEPFFTTKDISKGSGLGLPQVYGFAQQSGGRVSIASEVGGGTVVTILLPRSRRPAAEAETAAAPAVPAARPRREQRGHVLLVEDDREVSALTRELLGSLGFRVTHVASAEAALGAFADERRIDIVLSDIMMPGGVSGLQLAREIRRRHPDVPVILTTGYVESAAGMKDGEFTLIAKPFDIEALANALGVDQAADAH
jgi:CheY-like chemotaxis protein